MRPLTGSRTLAPQAGSATKPSEGASARSGRLASGIVTTLLTKVVSVGVPLLLVPLTLGYLGSDLYGLWMAVAAVTGMAAFADLGLGNSLMTKVAKSHATSDFKSARGYVSTAYFMVSLFALSLLSLLWASAWLIPWTAIFNASNVPANEVRWMVLSCISAFLINVPLSLVVRVQYACQQVRQSNLWQAAGSLLTLPLTALAVSQDLPPALVVTSTLVGPLIVTCVNTACVYSRGNPELAPSLRAMDRSTAQNLITLSGLFFVLTIVMTISSSADSLVVTHVMGLDSVTAFSVSARLFAQLGVIVSVMNLPLWPANAEALAAGETGWVRKITRRMTVISAAVAVLLSGALVGFGDDLMELWLGQTFGSDQPLLLGFAVWWVLLSAVSPIFMVQNAVGVVKPQLLGWAAYLLISLPAKWIAVEHSGIAGVPWAGFFVYGMTVVPAAIIGYRSAVKGTPSHQSLERRHQSR